ncbi:MAG TPA: twin-arginine translocase TatA/TatE family subunit [Flavobacterium sp.]
MFGIGGGEFLFIIFIILMFFGSDKIPEMARTLGKGMAQLRNATNEIKSDIRNSAAESGLDMNTLTGGISEEIQKAKEGFNKVVQDSADATGIKSEITQLKQDFTKIDQDINASAADSPAVEPIDGTVKRQG